MPWVLKNKGLIFVLPRSVPYFKNETGFISMWRTKRHWWAMFTSTVACIYLTTIVLEAPVALTRLQVPVCPITDWHRKIGNMLIQTSTPAVTVLYNFCLCLKLYLIWGTHKEQNKPFKKGLIYQGESMIRRLEFNRPRAYLQFLWRLWPSSWKNPV